MLPFRVVSVLPLMLAISVSAFAAQDAPTRLATQQDLQRLGEGDTAVVKRELGTMGLHQQVGKACRTFIPVDSIRPSETPIPAPNGGTATVPFASFLIWSSDRPFDRALFYHVFSRPGSPKGVAKAPVQGGPNASIALRLEPDGPLPSADRVPPKPAGESGSPLETKREAAGHDVYALPAYSSPTQKDDPASSLPAKSENTLRTTCLIDPQRATNCLCAGTD